MSNMRGPIIVDRVRFPKYQTQSPGDKMRQKVEISTEEDVVQSLIPGRAERQGVSGAIRKKREVGSTREMALRGGG